MPANLAKTELVVRPCVALLHSFDPATGANADPETDLIPRLDAREVAAVFTARFDDFLKLVNGEGRGEGDWYRGSWSLWHNSNWRSKLIFPFSSLFFLSRLGILHSLRRTPCLHNPGGPFSFLVNSVA
jgi:hypothetical protein